MRPKKHAGATSEGDLFRARLDQIINLKHELVQLAGKIDWEWIDGEIAPLFSDKGGPHRKPLSVIGLLLLKHMFGLSDEGVVRALGLRSVLPALHRRDVLPAHLPARAFRPSAIGARGLGDKLDLAAGREPAGGVHDSTSAAHPGTWRGSPPAATPRSSPRRSRSRLTPSCYMRRSRGSIARLARCRMACS